MLKLASMKPSFPQDQKSLEIFDIPDDYYAKMSPVSSNRKDRKSTSPKFTVFNSFDIYGNEINNKTRRLDQCESKEQAGTSPDNSGIMEVDKENNSVWLNRMPKIKTGGLKLQVQERESNLISSNAGLSVSNKMEEENNVNQGKLINKCFRERGPQAQKRNQVLRF